MTEFYEQIDAIFSTALTQLEHIYRVRTVHNDIAPENMLVIPTRPAGAPARTGYEVKWIDFGVEPNFEGHPEYNTHCLKVPVFLNVFERA